MTKIHTTIEYLQQQLQGFVVDVQYKHDDTNIVVPLTLRVDLTQGPVPDDKPGHIWAWNLVTEQYTAIPIDDIQTHAVRASIPKDESNRTSLHEPNSLSISRASACKEALSRMDIPDKYNAVMDKEVCHHNMSNSVIKMMGVFNCTHQDLVCPSKDIIERCKVRYMDYIREHREDAFKELDQLEVEAKEQNGSDSDLEDINQIKQMFRDIPQETDLSKYSSVTELLSFWPSLLLPKPPEIHEQCTWWIEQNPARSMDQLEAILHKCDDVSELKALLAALADSDDEYPAAAVCAVIDRVEQLQE